MTVSMFHFKLELPEVIALFIIIIVTYNIVLATRKKTGATAPSSSIYAINNLPRGEEFVVNKRGQRLHLRTYVPADQKNMKAIIFYFHGYGAHVSSPTPRRIGEDFSKEGYLVVMHDHIGHGHSEGERAYIETHEHYIDDCLQLIELVTNGCVKDTRLKKLAGGTNYSIAVDESLMETIRGLKYALMGQSLGGGMCLLTGRALTSEPVRPEVHPERFIGVTVLCPAVKGNLPPAPIVWLVRNVLVKFAPLMQVPSFLESVRRPDATWLSDDMRLRAEYDKWGMDGGLGWGHNTRIGMAVALIDMTGTCQNELPNITFPFLVLHDPGDEVVRFEGTRMLMEQSPSIDKTLLELPGKKHDLMSNAHDIALPAILQWLEARLSGPKPVAVAN